MPEDKEAKAMRISLPTLFKFIAVHIHYTYIYIEIGIL